MASDYAGIANYWKFYDGETKQLMKYDVYGQKKKAEEEFQHGQRKPEYQNIFQRSGKQHMKHGVLMPCNRVYMNEGILGSPLLAYAASSQQVETALVKPGTSSDDMKKAVDAANTCTNRIF